MKAVPWADVDVAFACTSKNLGVAGATVPAGLVLMLIMGPDWSTGGGGFAYIGVAVVVTTSGYYLVTAAMRLAPAAIVSPFRYTILIWAIILGIVIFGDLPDAWTLAGAAVIVATGVFTFYRERRLSRMPISATSARL